MRLGQLIDKAILKSFRKYFAWFGGLGTKSRFFLIYQPTALNQKPTMMSILLKVCTETVQNS